jgi:hypothetical protein
VHRFVEHVVTADEAMDTDRQAEELANRERSKWMDGIADTGCIATHGLAVAIADRNGNLYLSGDTGRGWSSQTYDFPLPSSVLIA